MFGFGAKKKETPREFIPGQLIYRCRLCGAEFGVPVEGFWQSVFIHQFVSNDYRPKPEIHHCDNGQLKNGEPTKARQGIADLIGGSYVNDVVKKDVENGQKEEDGSA